MYQGANQEFIEFTNVGGAAVDMSGWSYDDDSRTIGAVNLSAYGLVLPGQSVLLTESSEADFRAAWSLSSSVRIIGGLTTNLGRNDEINLFDAVGALADRLTYGDQNLPGSIRTQTRSGWVMPAGVGQNNILMWTLAASGDASGSRVSAGGDSGNPGVYPFSSFPVPGQQPRNRAVWLS
ncbi:MAG: lamin tail domain-containing protein [Cytophagales bacterium]|nr:lamin tail domain-containing protein [Armatimonadota bacterium]